MGHYWAGLEKEVILAEKSNMAMWFKYHNPEYK